MNIIYKIFLFFLFFTILIQANFKVEFGEASYYNDKYQGKLTASGEKFDQNKFTAAHKKLPFGTILLVTNLENKKTVKVRVNDRGPFSPGRIIDLSRIGATKLGYIKKGLTKVKIEVINKDKLPIKNKFIKKSSTNKVDFLEKENIKLKQENIKLQKAVSHWKNKYTKTVKLKNIKDKSTNNYKKIIQVGVFNSLKNAKVKQEKIKKKIFNSYPIKINKNDNNTYKVQIINIRDKDVNSFVKKYKLQNIYIY